MRQCTRRSRWHIEQCLPVFRSSGEGKNRRMSSTYGPRQRLHGRRTAWGPMALGRERTCTVSIACARGRRPHRADPGGGHRRQGGTAESARPKSAGSASPASRPSEALSSPYAARTSPGEAAGGERHRRSKGAREGRRAPGPRRRGLGELRAGRAGASRGRPRGAARCSLPLRHRGGVVPSRGNLAQDGKDSRLPTPGLKELQYPEPEVGSGA